MTARQKSLINFEISLNDCVDNSLIQLVTSTSIESTLAARCGAARRGEDADYDQDNDDDELSKTIQEVCDLICYKRILLSLVPLLNAPRNVS